MNNFDYLIQLAIKQERERIIKLLKNYTGWSGTFEAQAADIIEHIRRDKDE